MKILIAEDNNEKIGQLREVLRGAGLSDDDSDIAYTVKDAKTALAGTDYDLLILDVILPLFPGDPAKASHSVSLLTELTERNSLRRPKHILGLTAFDDAIREAGPEFLKRTWSVIKYATDSKDWKEQIRNSISYIRNAPAAPQQACYRTDLCIVTALLSPEFDAVMKNGWAWSPAEPLNDNTFIRRATFKSSGKDYTAVAAFAPTMGMVASALLAAKLIEALAPRFLTMAGICGGIKDKVKIGDVLIADPTWDWQSGKHFVEDGVHGFAIAPEPVPLASFVRARIDQMRGDRGFLSKLREGFPRTPDADPKLKPGPIASGSSVLADDQVVLKVVGQNRNLVGVEMEAYGVASACRSATHPRPTPIICKSVCDFADELKNSEWQEYAAYCSAQVIREFFERYMSEIQNLAGTQ
jgi:nucleoside phosphorylase/CheY-like chemotaxis protein